MDRCECDINDLFRGDLVVIAVMVMVMMMIAVILETIVGKTY